MTRPLHVFLCHSSNDKPAVRELYQKLSAETWIDPWLDKAKILPGQDWEMVIEKAVEVSDVVIICLSNQSVTKEGFVQREIRYAYDIALEKPEATIFLIPLRLDDCIVPRKLRSLHWVDYFGDDKGDAYSDLIEALKIRYEQKIPLEEELERNKIEEQMKRETEELARKLAAEYSVREIVAKEEKEKAEREAQEKIARLSKHASNTPKPEIKKIDKLITSVSLEKEIVEEPNGGTPLPFKDINISRERQEQKRSVVTLLQPKEGDLTARKENQKKVPSPTSKQSPIILPVVWLVALGVVIVIIGLSFFQKANGTETPVITQSSEPTTSFQKANGTEIPVIIQSSEPATSTQIPSYTTTPATNANSNTSTSLKPGKWRMFYSPRCNTYLDTISLSINADGIFNWHGETIPYDDLGTWTVQGNTVSLLSSNGNGSNRYYGTILGEKIINGRIFGELHGGGCWDAIFIE